MRRDQRSQTPSGSAPRAGALVTAAESARGKGAPRLRVQSWGLQLCAGAPSAGMDEGRPEPRADGGSPWTAGRPRVWVCDQEAPVAEPARLSRRGGLPLVVESHESGPEDGNRLYPLKSIVLNAQDRSYESGMS